MPAAVVRLVNQLADRTFTQLFRELTPVMTSRHDYSLFKRCDVCGPIDSVFEHRPASYKRAVLFRTMSAQPPQDERLDSFSFASGQDDRPHILIFHVLFRHDPCLSPASKPASQ